MVLYRVELKLDPQIQNEFLSWLPKHMEDMLKLEGFEEAQGWQDAEDNCHVVVDYHLTDSSALEEYLQKHAPRMRDEADKLFAGKMTRTWKVLKKIDN